MVDVIVYLELGAQILGGLVVIATVVVQLTPGDSDNKVVKKYADLVLKFMRYLPTLGVNPKTKQLEKAYEELKREHSKA